MATITIGQQSLYESIDIFQTGGWAWFHLTQADGTGYLNTMKAFPYAEDIINVRMGTFSYSGDYYNGSMIKRDYESLGTLYQGSVNTVSGLNCDVIINDYLGIDFNGGYVWDDYYGGGHWHPSNYGDAFDGNVYSVTRYGYSIPMFGGSGLTVVIGKKWNGITISKWNGVTVSKINTI